MSENIGSLRYFTTICTGDSSDETKAKLHKRMKIVVSEKPEPKTIEIFNVKNIRGTRKSKESKNLTTIALDSSNIFQKLEANTDGVRNADTDLVKAECKDFDEKYTAMSADDDGDNDNDDNNDNGDNNDDGDDNMDDGEESSVKHKDFTANVDDDDLDGDGDSVLSELDHEDDFENEESDIDTKPSVTDRKIAKAKPSKKSVVS